MQLAGGDGRGGVGDLLGGGGWRILEHEHAGADLAVGVKREAPIEVKDVQILERVRHGLRVKGLRRLDGGGEGDAAAKGCRAVVRDGLSAVAHGVGGGELG